MYSMAHASMINVLNTALLYDSNGTGNQLLSAGRDGRVRLWDLHTGKNSLVNYGGTRSTGSSSCSISVSWTYFMHTVFKLC